MKHKMRLHNKPFELIKQGTKTIELRLNDEKRSLINIGDIVVFENRMTLESMKTKVINLYNYNSFEELYENLDKEAIGYGKDEMANFKDMELYYSKDEQEKYGVVGIEIELLNKDKIEIINNYDNLSFDDINRVVRRTKVMFVNSDEITLCFSSGNYFFLGGHNDNDETDMECLYREVLEEAGVEIQFGELEPFMTIKYFNKNYPNENINTLSIINYYVMDYNIVPNYDNINLTEEEKNGNFEIVKFNKKDIIMNLENSLETATRKIITMDTINVIKEYLKSNK